ncbi:MAG: ImmA/IrrE family metallo-endopeptidase [Magnetococcales bacterium]|nr:ImmA/IrrE family metallo-endopeptidase [Magnetococcales bacterium]
MVDPVPETNYSRKSIERLGTSIARQLGYIPNGDIDAALRKAGGTIDYVPPWELVSSDSGSIIIDDLKKFTIKISHNTSASRDRFTVAHELGHYVLHYVMPSQAENKSLGPKAFNRDGGGRGESEANWFAAGFLMPEEDFRTAWNQENGDTYYVANRFGVSMRAATVRAKSLGLIPDE